MARVARIEQHGGPEVIQWVDVDLPDPGPGEVRIRATAVGLNFIEIYQRTGLYPLEAAERAGRRERPAWSRRSGAGVTGFAVGDRVGTFGRRSAAMRPRATCPPTTLIQLPDDVDDRTAAAILLKGGTTEFLIERCAKVQAGQTVLVHAAAGGVGHLAVGWLKAIGATVIGTVGSRGQGRARAARRGGSCHRIHEARTSPRACGRSPAARACR